MTTTAAQTDLGTHRVENQPPDLGDLDLFGGDQALSDHVAGIDHDARDGLAAYGAALGTADMQLAAREANRHPPDLVPFDRAGRRLDEVRFHPAYHRFMDLSCAAGYAAIPWEGQTDGHLRHAAMVYLASQMEPGHCCPLTMTYAAIPTLPSEGSPFPVWRERLVSRHYDPTVRPVAEKAGATLGMALTEKQGGSDVRSNTTRAERDGENWRLTGHKWFCSAPMSDGFLTLAQAPAGLTCFLVPRWLPEGRNAIRLMRLKDKLGNRSNASAEIEYHRALAFQVGDEGQGLRAIIEMIHHTRLDTALAPAGLMRAALREAHHWVSHRTAFQRTLIDQPLMRAVLADLALDFEGSLALGLHVARAFDGGGPEDRAFARIGVALAKFLSNKLCPMVIGEALECLGGAGYVEDSPVPMLYREAPLNGIWEGSGNVICLDVLRTLARLPAARTGLDAELDAGASLDRTYARALREHRDRWPQKPQEAEARWFVEQTALLLAASVLLRRAPPGVAEAFVHTRLTGRRGRGPGTIGSIDTDAVLERIYPNGQATQRQQPRISAGAT
ncbi:acyl-CoA dehydrogenase family protein [Tropicimonas isoalkanivorans]|uniref:Putative acyl-CoA dehydrogenase n=1 Tax=Tropicimonas isoalkanivorans TaxID=441112 RepID=A0A1I1EL96_9RHOB|nr:acyl-CoA dehydrogenase family protein [Tropicimonas isoalkanivorans]SFB85750.1 putative acyl-CoA dehydrogenase [Tropicimonas isoalkanivorans]